MTDMKMSPMVLSISILLLSSFTISSSFAQSEILLNLDKSSYNLGELIQVTGNIKGKANQLVAVEVKDPNGVSVMLRTLTTDASGNFYIEFKLPPTAKTGTYNTNAKAMVDGVVLTKSIEFVQKSTAQPSSPTAQPSSPTAQPSSPTAQPSSPTTTPSTPKSSGGCLIATATYGSELAPQVQMLRELRDNVVMKTKSGSGFMESFNSFYYTFSPTIADWERESPIFKESVKISLTPLITTLSILNYVGINSEFEMLSFGIGIIMLNVGMYVVTPFTIVKKIRKHLSN